MECDMRRTKYPKKPILLTAIYLINYLAIFIYSTSFMIGFGLSISQITFVLGWVNIDNWLYVALAIVLYLTTTISIALCLKCSRYKNKFELRGNFVRTGGVLIIFICHSYYLNFPDSATYFYFTPFIALLLFVIFLTIHLKIKDWYYYICLGKNPADMYLTDIRELETQDEKNRLVVEAHRKTIDSKYRNFLDVYRVLSRKNGNTGIEEYAIFYGTELKLFRQKRIVPLFKTIISLDELIE